MWTSLLGCGWSAARVLDEPLAIWIVKGPDWLCPASPNWIIDFGRPARDYFPEGVDIPDLGNSAWFGSLAVPIATGERVWKSSGGVAAGDLCVVVYGAIDAEAFTAIARAVLPLLPSDRP